MTGKKEELLKVFKDKLNNISLGLEGIKELEKIFNYLKISNIDPRYYQFAPFIARGLAYYTGPIWEFEILDGNVGSVAGCGRYDNTIGRFVGKKIPATGGSFGIERIVEIIKDRKMANLIINPTKVLVTIFSEEYFQNSLVVANYLRANNIPTMLYSDLNSRIDKQLKYADRKKIPYVVIIGPDEVKQKKVGLRNMKTRQQQLLTLEEIIKIIQATNNQILNQ